MSIAKIKSGVLSIDGTPLGTVTSLEIKATEMRFERLHRGEKIMARVLDRESAHVRMYGAKVGHYQFIIIFDEFYSRWTASYRNTKPESVNITIDANGWPDPDRKTWFATQNDAENACRKAWKLLRAEPKGNA